MGLLAALPPRVHKLAKWDAAYRGRCRAWLGAHAWLLTDIGAGSHGIVCPEPRRGLRGDERVPAHGEHQGSRTWFGVLSSKYLPGSRPRERTTASSFVSQLRSASGGGQKV